MTGNPTQPAVISSPMGSPIINISYSPANPGGESTSGGGGGGNANAQLVLNSPPKSGFMFFFLGY